ncbi:hypothetical protein JOB18_021677 [Solea senegalensis]|uniref:Uncharacterized protein n=1 Tax=Solea senegalensis TaxID=28829 RepID=A0AAV6T6U3_SOLSE|nr:hypothetical protein JOB18_021677 [Solea senegalensis]
MEAPVEDVPHAVCGQETTCEEVVEALAQVLSMPGDYMLQEKFNDVEQCMTRNKQLLETLEKCSKQAREVQHPASGSLTFHCQSLPALPCLRHEAEQPKEDTKRPKKMSLMKEALEWLENLGKGKVNRQTRGKESKHRKKRQEAKSDDPSRSSCVTTDDDKNHLKKIILSQLSCLRDLEAHIDHVEKHIFELEEKQRTRGAEQEAQQTMSEHEIEQIMFWQNELKEEEQHEKDLQCQCTEMRVKAVEFQAMLEEYKHKIQGLDFFATQNGVNEDFEVSKVGANAATEVSTEDAVLNGKGFEC